MNCNSCSIARPLNHCSDSISIGTFEADTDYFIYLKNISSGNTMRFEATSDADGLLIITTTAIEFVTTSDYELWATLADATNQHDNVLFSLGDGYETVNDVPCLLLKFEKVVDNANCCVCLSEQVILLERSLNPADPICECVTQEDVERWNDGVQSVSGPFVDNTDPRNPVVRNPLQDGFIVKPQITWLQNYDYELSDGIYVIGGVLHSSPITQITLDPSDPTDDRIDAFVVTTSNAADKVTGSPATPAVEPDIDPTTQLKVGIAIVQANTTAPSLTIEPIYLENTEWVTAVSGAGINAASLNNPCQATTAIEGTNVSNNQFITFTPVAFPFMLPFAAGGLVFQIRSKAQWNNPSRLVFQFYNGTSTIGSAVQLGHNLLGFISSDTTNCQNINIPVSSFGNVAAATNLRITKTGGGTIGFYLDNIRLMAMPVSSSTTIFRSYVATLQQTGTNAPTATVLYNDLGNIVWTRDAVGRYFGTLAGAFQSTAKFWAVAGCMTEGISVFGRVPFIRRGATADFLILETYTITANVPNTSTLTDQALGGVVDTGGRTSIEIRVYL